MPTRRISPTLRLLLSLWFLTLVASALQTGDAAAGKRDGVRDHGLPRTIRFSGVVADDAGSPSRGTLALTFALYSEAQGSAPAWVETQNVTLDDRGRYTVLLGAASDAGLPIALFAQGEARWLGVRVAEEGAAEQARVMLVSVPYALAAADARTLGGRPVTDFQLTRAAATASGDGSAPGVVISPMVNTTSNTVNRVARFTGEDTVGDSIIFDNGSNIGIGTTTPTALFHVAATAGDGFNLYTSSPVGGSVAVYANHFGAAPIGYAGFFTKTGTGTTNIGLYAEASGGTNNYAAIFQAGNVGIGTGAPSQKLEVAGTIYSTTGGFKFPDGTTQLSAATTCTSNCGGTISGVTAGTGLTGGGTIGTVTLNLAPGSALYAQIDPASPQTGSINLAGSISATSLSLPATTDSNTGVIKMGGIAFLHRYGLENTFVGEAAGNFTMTSNSNSNTAVGFHALMLNTQGGNNTAIGVQALQQNTFGGGNTATGHQSLSSNTEGTFNTAMGHRALQANTSGVYNSALGTSALLNNTTGSGNTASGVGALSENTTGINNTASGSLALAANTIGSNNTASGVYSLRNGSGNYNAATGVQSLEFNSTGSNNTAIGSGALRSNTAGNNNTALGFGAGETPTVGNQNVTGSLNTFVGYSSGPGTSTQLDNATAIGANALVSASNSLVLGASNVSVGIGTSAPTEKLDVAGIVRSSAGGFKFPDGTTQTTAALSNAGTITGVTAGTGLTGGGTSGAVGLAIDSTVARTNANNNFTTSQNIIGGLTATGALTALNGSFIGSGGGVVARDTLNDNTSRYGIQGVVDSAGGAAGAAGVFGLATSASGVSAGLRGMSLSTSGYGVRGDMASPTPSGAISNGIGVYGTYGYNQDLSVNPNATGGFAMYAKNRAPNGVGLMAEANGFAGTALWAKTTTIAGPTVGIRSTVVGDGTAGQFESQDETGWLLKGISNGTEKFLVGGNGVVYAEVFRDFAGNIMGSGTIAGVTAGTGLTGGGATGAVTLNANLTTSGGDNGSATTIARGDHLHDARYLQLSGGTLTGSVTAPSASVTGSLNAGSLTLPSNGKFFLADLRLFHTSGGLENTFFGKEAGNFTLTGSNSTGLGAYALAANTTGESNTAVGTAALYSNTEGYNNAAFGTATMWATTTGSDNTAFGTAALDGNTTGSRNTAVGFLAGSAIAQEEKLTTGTDNTFIGYRAGLGSSLQIQNSTAIGANARVTNDNSLILGSNGVQVGIGNTAPQRMLHLYRTNTNPVLRVEAANASVSSILELGRTDNFWQIATTVGSQDSFAISNQQSGGAFATRLFIHPVTGNVGIANPVPTQKLDITGNVIASGSVTAASFIGSGSSLSGVSAADSASLGGFSAANYARTNAVNSFSVRQSISSSTTEPTLGITQNSLGDGLAVLNSTDGTAIRANSVQGFAIEATSGASGGSRPTIRGSALGADGIGVRGETVAATGVGIGIHGLATGSAAVAGIFEHLNSGSILSARAAGVEHLRVDGTGDVVVNGGDISAIVQGKGIILRATDGANCFRITVNNAGVLSTTAATCPTPTVI